MNEATHTVIAQCLVDFGKDLLDEIALHGEIITLNSHEVLVKQGQIIRHLPIVIHGAIKVFSEEDGMQFLLYYVHPGATCVFSFANLLGKKAVNFSGIAEKDSKILLIPAHKAKEWIIKYPVFNELIMNAYQKSYDDLLTTTKQIICYNLESRLMSYLNDKVKISGSELLGISHQNVADDLATSREVISRLLKKMEKEGKVKQVGRKIKVTAHSGKL